MQFREETFKSVINKKKFIDSWFWDRYSINPYRGCSFGCIYCDARSDKYQSPLDFENDIIIKKDIGIQLENRLAKARTLLPDVVGVGGVTDCYQPAERKHKNTRRVLEVLHKHKFPVHLVTKSDLFIRDLDLIQAIQADTWAAVSVTITTLDEEISRFLEVRSPTPKKRLQAITKAKRSTGSPQVGALLIPIVPFLTDKPREVENLVMALKDAGADYLLFGAGMSMRDSQALWFLQHLNQRFPALIDSYQKLYSFKYNRGLYTGRNGPTIEYQHRINQMLLEVCDRVGIQVRIKRHIPDDYRKDNYLVAEKLLNTAYLRQVEGKPHTDLFWAGQNIQNLKLSIQEVSQQGNLSSINNVQGEILKQVEKLLEAPENLN